ncbi:acylphosphatase [Luteolibacter luteus]|uniref:acylphosphatase n=1 Tax=Luteolibacter luteus TaxID=2728835 RepID=A0A858RHT4_9BACT|nr:acylphosphatase [Luteolibacter luteus]QJE95653.1 acylphosphatase [Luteolibacter luteus]
MIARRVIFEGRVQGVGFRYTTKDLSKGFEVCGTVKNLPDGTVELEVMGEREEVEAFLKEIAEESPLSHNIKSMHVKNIPPLEGVKGFTIER